MRRRDLITAALATSMAQAAHAASASPGLAATGKPVVLELFTSQGCSSCPPADALLGQLSRRPGVIALAWHIDYWDNLGWRDPFASRKATERQKDYARRIGETVFTPALVVNGTTMVVGSEGKAVQSAIDMAAPLSVAVALNRGPEGILAQVGGGEGPLRALLAIYDAEHATDVRAGENQGERLREYRIVREAQVMADWDGTERRFVLPTPGPVQGAVVLVQSAGLRVVGAADLPPA